MADDQNLYKACQTTPPSGGQRHTAWPHNPAPPQHLPPGASEPLALARRRPSASTPNARLPALPATSSPIPTPSPSSARLRPPRAQLRTTTRAHAPALTLALAPAPPRALVTMLRTPRRGPHAADPPPRTSERQLRRRCVQLPVQPRLAAQRLPHRWRLRRQALLCVPPLLRAAPAAGGIPVVPPYRAQLWQLRLEPLEREHYVEPGQMLLPDGAPLHRVSRLGRIEGPRRHSPPRSGRSATGLQTVCKSSQASRTSKAGRASRALLLGMGSGGENKALRRYQRNVQVLFRDGAVRQRAHRLTTEDAHLPVHIAPLHIPRATVRV